MLINVRISELVTDNNNSVPLAVMIGIIFNLTLYKLLPSNFTANTYIYDLDKTSFSSSLHGTTSNNISYALGNLFYSNNNDLSFVSSQIWDGALAETSHITSIGNIIYTAYPL